MISKLDQNSIKILKSKKIYSLEGNIGAGKTTILKMIAKNFENVAFVEEPVNQWTNLNGNDLLKCFYENPDRWGYSFEFYSMLTKLKNLVMAAIYSDKPIIVIERSLVSNKVFIDISKKLGKLTPMEYKMLMVTYDFYLKNIYPELSGIIYINTPVDICVQRIAKRNRNGECEIDKGYLELLNEKFIEIAEKYGNKCYIIDGLYNPRNDAEKISKGLKEFIKENEKIILK